MKKLQTSEHKDEHAHTPESASPNSPLKNSSSLRRFNSEQDLTGMSTRTLDKLDEERRHTSSRGRLDTIGSESRTRIDTVGSLGSLLPSDDESRPHSRSLHTSGSSERTPNDRPHSHQSRDHLRSQGSHREQGTPSLSPDKRSKKDSMRRHARVLTALAALEHATLNPATNHDHHDGPDSEFKRNCFSADYHTYIAHRKASHFKSKTVEGQWEKIHSDMITFQTLVDVGTIRSNLGKPRFHLSDKKLLEAGGMTVADDAISDAGNYKDKHHHHGGPSSAHTSHSHPHPHSHIFIPPPIFEDDDEEVQENEESDIKFGTPFLKARERDLYKLKISPYMTHIHTGSVDGPEILTL